MKTQIDTLDIPTTGSRFALGLNVMLGVASVFLGLVVLGMSIFALSMFFGGAPHDLVYAELNTAASSGEIDIRIGSWFLVFVIAALSEVFRHGALLRRDQEFTV